MNQMQFPYMPPFPQTGQGMIEERLRNIENELKKIVEILSKEQTKTKSYIQSDDNLYML